MVQKCCEFVDEMEKDSSLAHARLALIDCLRLQTNGKIYVEVERARLTLKLAVMKEAKGDHYFRLLGERISAGASRGTSAVEHLSAISLKLKICGYMAHLR